MEKLRGLHVLTDREIVGSKPLIEVIKLAINGGATVIQLRDKKVADAAMILLGKELIKLTGGKVPLIVDDRINVALAIGADGVHVGQEDMPAKKVRQLIGKKMILGVSAHTVTEAIKAQQDEADYVGVGPVFATASKIDAKKPIGLSGLRRIKDVVTIPVIAIGGINITNAPAVANIADGLAVISAVLKATDPLMAAQKLSAIIDYEKKYGSIDH